MSLQPRMPNGVWKFIFGAVLGAWLGLYAGHYLYVVRPDQQAVASRGQCIDKALSAGIRLDSSNVSGHFLHRAVIANSDRLRQLTGEAFQINGDYHSSGSAAFPDRQYFIATGYVCVVMRDEIIRHRVIRKLEDEYIYISYSKEGEETGSVSLGPDLGIGDIPGT